MEEEGGVNGEPAVDVSASDWEATPVSVQRLVAQLMLTVQQLRAELVELRRDNEALRKENEALRAHNTQLTARVAELEEKLRTNSRNSSKPPSSDPPSTPPPPTRRNKNKRNKGGQKGHKGTHRALLPPEQVDAFVVCKPTTCSGCKKPIAGHDQAPQRHQVHELAPKLIHTTEYQLHELTCPCGAHTRAPLPSGVGLSPFGSSIQALTAVLVGGFKLSHAGVVEMMRDVFGLSMSTGAVTNTLVRASNALEPVYDEARDAARKAEVAHADETSWRVGAKKAWLWVLCTPLLEVLRVAKGRSEVSGRKLLGRVFKGTLVTDRYAVYGRIASKQQYCHAHLYRDWFKVEQRGGEDEAIGLHLRRLTRRLLRAHRRKRREGLTQNWLRKQLVPIQRSYAEWLVHGFEQGSAKTRELCSRLHASQSKLWTFVMDESVEPTNNRAERALRHAVLLRKNSYGNDSARGARFMERLLTVRGSLRRQGQRLLSFVVDCIAAVRNPAARPSLLPAVAA
jgi:transposase